MYNIKGRLKRILSKNFDVNCELIKKDTNLSQSLNLDSLDMIELVMLLEDEFGVDISDDSYENFVTFNDLVNYISVNAKK